MKKALFLLLLILFGAQSYSQPRDTTTLLAITFEVDYYGSEPYMYYWALPVGLPRGARKLAQASPIFVTYEEEFFMKFIVDKHRTVKDTLGLADTNGLYKSDFKNLGGYMGSMIEAIDNHRVLVQKEKVRNRFGYSEVGPLKYTTRVYLTPIRGVFGQFTKREEYYTLPVFYPASEIEYDEQFWKKEREEGWKWPNYLRIPFMVLSGCETSPDFSFIRIFFKGGVE